MAADCTARFEPATYSTFLAPKMVESLAALAQQKDLDEAFNGVEGFEKCPCVSLSRFFFVAVAEQVLVGPTSRAQVLPVRVSRREPGRTPVSLREASVPQSVVPQVPQGASPSLYLVHARLTAHLTTSRLFLCRRVTSRSLARRQTRRAACLECTLSPVSLSLSLLATPPADPRHARSTQRPCRRR